MIKEVFLNKCKCEICKTIVNSTDFYCRVCGNELQKDIQYVEVKQEGIRSSKMFE